MSEQRKHRDFNGNPLAYFKEHYGNRKITRGQLQKKDKGMYHALLGREQLDEAIPSKYPNTTRLLEDIAGGIG